MLLWRSSESAHFYSVNFSTHMANCCILTRFPAANERWLNKLMMMRRITVTLVSPVRRSSKMLSIPKRTGTEIILKGLFTKLPNIETICLCNAQTPSMPATSFPVKSSRMMEPTGPVKNVFIIMQRVLKLPIRWRINPCRAASAMAAYLERQWIIITAKEMSDEAKTCKILHHLHNFPKEG